VSPQLTARTRVFAILGDPVAHTLSPAIQNAAIRAANLDAAYVALRVAAGDVAGVMRTLAGGNVTIPHKGTAADALDRATARVRQTRACNTFWTDGKRLLGDNTDVIGFSVALRRLLPDVAGARVLVVGAGGAARAALYALLEDGAETVTVVARARGRRKEIGSVAGRRARRVDVVANAKQVRGELFDLVVNATPLGLQDKDPAPLDLSQLGGVRAVFDMVYRPEGTRWSRYAAECGIPAMDGKEMLLQQAAAAFEIWWETGAPIKAMRAAIALPRK
jgi:shikimate dehydrogenase